MFKQFRQDISYDKEPNLTDVNTGGSPMDEDGNLEEEHNDEDVNSGTDAEPEEDSSPAVHSCVVRLIPDKNPHMEIIATITVPAELADEEVEFTQQAVVKDAEGKVQVDPRTGKTIYKTITTRHRPVLEAGGLKSKRMVIPGDSLTALELAEHIFNIASW